MKDLKDEIVDNDDDEILNNVNELAKADRTIEDLKKDYPDKIIKLEGDLKILRTEFPVTSGSI